MKAVLIGCGVFFILELVLAMDHSLPECLLAGGAAGFALWGTLAFARAARLHFRFRARDLLQAWRLGGYAVMDTAKVLHALGRQLFTAAGADSYLGLARYEDVQATPLAAGRRALAVTYVSSTPNSIVLEIMREEGTVLFHQVQREAPNALAQDLGTGAEDWPADRSRP